MDGTPKWDGENKGKAYEQMGWFGGKKTHPYFWKHLYSWWFQASWKKYACRVGSFPQGSGWKMFNKNETTTQEKHTTFMSVKEVWLFEFRFFVYSLKGWENQLPAGRFGLGKLNSIQWSPLPRIALWQQGSQMHRITKPNFSHQQFERKVSYWFMGIPVHHGPNLHVASWKITIPSFQVPQKLGDFRINGTFGFFLTWRSKAG